MPVARRPLGGSRGFFGGISGVWGPPTVVMLTARSTGIAEQMRIQGVIYGLGALVLLGAHVGSGRAAGADLAPVAGDGAAGGAGDVGWIQVARPG